MVKSYLDLRAQIEKLQTEANALRAKEISDVVSRIKEAIRHYGITAQELGLKSARAPYGSKKAAPVPARTTAAKYGDGQGNTWGGRGPRPAWLREALAQGHTLEDYAGEAASSARKGTSAKASRKTTSKSTAKARKTPPGKRKGSGGRVSKGQATSTSPRAEVFENEDAAT